MQDILIAALEAFPNFVVVDTAGKVVHINEGYARLLGTTVRHAIGSPVETIIPGTRLLYVLKTGQAEMGAIMTLYDHVSEQNVTLVCNRIPIRKNGRLIGALGATTIENIAEIGRLSREIEVIRRERQRYKNEVARLKYNASPMRTVVGTSPQITHIKELIQDYADSNLSILVTGETGTGKEVFARAIHMLSKRADNNYVKINCAAIPANLLESELFGYEPGSFTGAAKTGKTGKFELANKGTLLLDEISEMPLNLQSKLLRVLQEKEIERVGGIKPIPVDVRIICCTNRNLEQMAREGKFRADLYYRINVVELHIPPLRERVEDIAPLSQFFVDKINQENGYAISGIDAEVRSIFENYAWPGNVRELEHTIERAAVRCKVGIIGAKHVDFMADRVHQGTMDSTLTLPSLRASREQAEYRQILQALEQAKGNKAEAARLLGIDRSQLYSKLKKYKISGQ